MPQPNYSFYKNFGDASYALRGPVRPGCLLFAEGDSEALFLERWLLTIQCDSNDIAVICFKGGDNLETVFKNFSSEENFAYIERFGFFLDAEGNSASQKATMVSTLLKKFSIIPNGHNVRAGQLSQVGNKRIALFVSPDNASSGYIEHTVMNEILTDNLYPCIEAFRKCVEQTSGNPVSPKSLVQAYIGAYKPGLCGTGRGFHSDVLKVMHDAYATVRNTLSAVL